MFSLKTDPEMMDVAAMPPIIAPAGLSQDWQMYLY